MPRPFVLHNPYAATTSSLKASSPHRHAFTYRPTDLSPESKGVRQLVARPAPVPAAHHDNLLREEREFLLRVVAKLRTAMSSSAFDRSVQETVGFAAAAPMVCANVDIFGPRLGEAARFALCESAANSSPHHGHVGTSPSREHTPQRRSPRNACATLASNTSMKSPPSSAKASPKRTKRRDDPDSTIALSPPPSYGAAFLLSSPPPTRRVVGPVDGGAALTTRATRSTTAIGPVSAASPESPRRVHAREMLQAGRALQRESDASFVRATAKASSHSSRPRADQPPAAAPSPRPVTHTLRTGLRAEATTRRQASSQPRRSTTPDPNHTTARLAAPRRPPSVYDSAPDMEPPRPTTIHSAPWEAFRRVARQHN
jgi:hypothetical protein